LRNLQLKEIKTGFERVDLRLPSLREYIEICKKYDKIAVLELKNPMTQDDVLGIIDEIKSLDYLENVVFISFHFDNLVYVKRHYPNQTVQFLTMDEKTEGLVEKLKSYNMDLDIWCKCITKEIVDECHANGIEVNCWTVDDSETAQNMIAIGVDYITTNILE